MRIALSRLALVAGLLSACVAGSVVAQPASPGPERNQLPSNEFAQPGASVSEAPGGMTPGSDPFMLLENSHEVQTDLGLNQDQIRRLGHSGQLFRTQLQDLAHATDESSKAEMKRQIWMSRGAIARILTADQLNRLQQIMLQIEGPCLAVNDERFSRDLDLSQAQTQKMAATCREVAGNMRTAFRPSTAGEDPCLALRANRARIDQLRADGQVRVNELLSTTQQRRLVEMQGRKLVLEPMMPPQCQRSETPSGS